jgi:hypothetical protein
MNEKALLEPIFASWSGYAYNLFLTKHALHVSHLWVSFSKHSVHSDSPQSLQSVAL